MAIARISSTLAIGLIVAASDRSCLAVIRLKFEVYLISSTASSVLVEAMSLT